MNNFEPYQQANHNPVTVDVLPGEIAARSSDSTLPNIDELEFFDYRINGDAKLLAVAPHMNDPLHSGEIFNQHQGRLLPKNGDSAQWLKLVRLTSDTLRPNILRLDDGIAPTHVTIAPCATDSTSIRVLLERSGPCSPDIFEAYCKLYHLTRAESAVVWLLTQGMEPKRIAAHNSVAVSTVRTQIKTALLKTEEASIRTMLVRITSIAYGHVAQNGRPGPGIRRSAQ
jgi:DNA-binding CsgD family transcriptional regulator